LCDAQTKQVGENTGGLRKGFLIIWKLWQPNLIPSLAGDGHATEKTFIYRLLAETSTWTAIAVWAERFERGNVAGRWA
jgi:hypothetical protein